MHEGDTRDSIHALAGEQGLSVEERRVGIDEWRDGVACGEITEVFACGTAAVITPVGRPVWDGGEAVTPVPGQAHRRRGQLGPGLSLLLHFPRPPNRRVQNCAAS